MFQQRKTIREEQEEESKSKIRNWFFNRLQRVEVHVQA